MNENFKKAIVIGGSSDIGGGIINELLKRGYKVYSTFNKTQPAMEDYNLIWRKVDLSNNDDILSFVEYVKKDVDRISIFIYNAGMTCRKNITYITDEDIYSVFNVNVFSCYKMIRDFMLKLVDDAKIIVTGSQMGVDPHSVSTLYGMSKSCLHAMVKNMVKEFDGTNITINAIIPGFVNTQWQKEKPQEIKQNIYNKTALHRFANIEEIVKGYMFCVDNSFVNGSLIEINGGYNYK